MITGMGTGTGTKMITGMRMITAIITAQMAAMIISGWTLIMPP
jgi:hypothetical protein